MAQDPEKVRERDRIKRRRQRENPEVREREQRAGRAYWARNADVIRQRKRERYAANKGKMRQWRALNKDQISEWGMRDRHGPLIAAWFAAAWQAQEGRCCLCGDELTAKRAVVDHDHRCCPDGKSCSYCRRGLSCSPCNTMIGMAADDPARMRRVADNLEVILKAADARLALKPEQETLL